MCPRSTPSQLWGTTSRDICFTVRMSYSSTKVVLTSVPFTYVAQVHTDALHVSPRHFNVWERSAVMQTRFRWPTLWRALQVHSGLSPNRPQEGWYSSICSCLVFSETYVNWTTCSEIVVSQLKKQVSVPVLVPQLQELHLWGICPFFETHVRWDTRLVKHMY